MKLFALSSLISIISAGRYASLGDDCYDDETICYAAGLECADWQDSTYGDMATCEDCKKSNKTFKDSIGEVVEYACLDFFKHRKTIKYQKIKGNSHIRKKKSMKKTKKRKSIEK